MLEKKKKNPTDFLTKKLFVGDASDAHAVLVLFHIVACLYLRNDTIILLEDVT